MANGIKELKALEGDVDFIAGVAGAIIYDVGGRRFSRITLDDSLGNAALHSAETGRFPLGARGAGRFAMQGNYYLRGYGTDQYADWPHSGQGGAFRTVGPTKIGVLTVILAKERQGIPLHRAYFETLMFTGKVVALIGVTLAAGVVTWVMSPIKFQADMGILLTFMFVWNMAGALILMPALAHFLLKPHKEKIAADPLA